MTPYKAALARAARVEGREESNAVRRRREHGAMSLVVETPTLSWLWGRFEQAGKANKADASNFKRVGKLLGNVQPAELTLELLEKAKSGWEGEGLAPQTVKHLLGLVRRIVRFAVSRDWCEGPAPSLRFPMPRVDNGKTECLTPAEVRQLLHALDMEQDQRLASLVRFALATGMRRAALLHLRWDDVDFERNFLTLRGESAKKRRSDVIPLTPVARRILQALLPMQGVHVFGCDGGPLDKGLRALLKRVKERAELPDGFRPLHGLRHTYASWLASSGEVDLYTLQKLLTHENPHMTQRYAHLADAALRRAAIVADRLFCPV